MITMTTTCTHLNGLNLVLLLTHTDQETVWPVRVEEQNDPQQLN